ncbi:MAG: adenylate/guanylate cyclase domain-containing protein [Syntrophales bacterium]|nr:adenylate/guanylate cyclase domain-containing protein [Syntrophales bacterium]MDD5643206.1 adenylate/guanylate cyclase domain-containing protein [Syntrophales bacterium]
MKNSGLATRLTFFILASTAVIFVLALAYNYYFSRSTIMAEVTTDARNLALATGNKIETLLQGVEKIPRSLAAIMEERPYSRKELVRLIKRLLVNNPEIYGISTSFAPFTFDPKSYYFAPYAYRGLGKIKVTFLGSNTYRYFFLDWYQIPTILQTPLWSEPYYDEGGGNIIMSTFSQPFYREREGKKEVWGVVTADVNLMGLKDLVAAVSIYQSGYAFLISQNGIFVTHPDKRLIMRESIFSVAAARHDPELRRIGRDMIRGGHGFMPVNDFVSGKKSWMYYTPLGSTGWTLGVIFPEAELFANVQRLSERLMFIGLIGLAFLGVVITLLARSITKPLRTLARSTAALGHGDFSVTVPESGARETRQLAQSFNALGEQLTEYMAKRDFIRDTFGRYVTQEVVKRLLESEEGLALGGETREVTLLFSDLRGFTALTADMDPEQVITFLNRYLEKMIEVLLEYRAVIDEIMGDGILAFFGAPEPLEDHPARAVACALAMQEAMEEINALNAADGLPLLEMGIAVNTGTVVVGNIGSERRTKYSAVGADVNFAARIESYALGGQVVIGPFTYQRVKDMIEVGSFIQAQMKGFPEATLYEVRAIHGPFNLRLQERREILQPLKGDLRVNIYRIQNKIITGPTITAEIIQLGENVAVVRFTGELAAWEDVRLHLLDADNLEIPGKIYGKVTAVAAGEGDLREAHISFTSVPPESRTIIQAALEGEPQA